jgi:hypothetical protein
VGEVEELEPWSQAVCWRYSGLNSLISLPQYHTLFKYEYKYWLRKISQITVWNFWYPGKWNAKFVLRSTYNFWQNVLRVKYTTEFRVGYFILFFTVCKENLAKFSSKILHCCFSYGTENNYIFPFRKLLLQVYVRRKKKFGFSGFRLTQLYFNSCLLFYLIQIILYMFRCTTIFRRKYIHRKLT